MLVASLDELELDRVCDRGQIQDLPEVSGLTKVALEELKTVH